MQKSPRQITKKFRDRFLAEITESLAEITESLAEINKKSVVLDKQQADLSEKIKNSGTLYLSENEVLTKIFSGLKIYLNPKDIAVAQHIALDNIWEPEITKAWINVLKSGDTILDIGANFGYFGLLAAQFTGRNKSKVYFFEANPNLIPYINKSLSINWFHEQSRVENYGVADKESIVTLNVLKDYIGSSSLQTMEELNSYMSSKMNLEVSEKIKVPTITIDKYVKQQKIRRVNLIKMDIEGYEEKAYQGMRETVHSSKDITLFVEFTKDSYDNPRKFYDQLLADFGNVYLIGENGQLHVPKKTNYADVIKGADNWVMPVFSKNPRLDKLN